MLIEKIYLKTRWDNDENFKHFKKKVVKKRSDFEDFIQFMSDGLVDMRYISFDGESFDNVDFTEANIEGGQFNGCEFIRCHFSNTILIDAIFKNCRISNCDFSLSNMLNATFRGGSIRESWFDQAKLYRVRITDVELTSLEGFQSYTARDALRKINIRSFRPTKGVARKWDVFKSRISTYILLIISCFFNKRSGTLIKDELDGNFESGVHLHSQLSVLLQRSGSVSESKIAEFLRMKSMLMSKSNSFSKRMIMWVGFVFGFVSKPLNISFWAIFIIILFSFIYMENDDYKYRVYNFGHTSDICVQRNNSYAECKMGFVEAIYFSSVTFATLGYGDIVPTKRESEKYRNFSLWIASIEALIGAILMALFVASIVRSILFS